VFVCAFVCVWWVCMCVVFVYVRVCGNVCVCSVCVVCVCLCSVCVCVLWDCVCGSIFLCVGLGVCLWVYALCVCGNVCVWSVFLFFITQHAPLHINITGFT